MLKTLRNASGVISCIFCLFLIWPGPAKAQQDEFAVDVKVEYKVEESGKTFVTHDFSIKNLTTNLYATSYTLDLEHISPESPQAFQGKKPLKINQKKEGEKTLLQIILDKPVVGKGNVNNFRVNFYEASFAQKTGEVWEIEIPRITQKRSFEAYEVTLSLPTSFGKEAYISPEPTRKWQDETRRFYVFAKESAAQSGITGGYGTFQVFSFNLTYHLENPLAKTSLVSVAIPPDTAFQKVYYQLIDPEPLNVEVDDDGNWLATYNLAPRQRLEVAVAGGVQIFASPLASFKINQDSVKNNLTESEFWQVSDPEIKRLASKYKTPRAIYDFVSTHLTYDYQRVRPNVVRLGAKKALETPKNAICMEFTDLFVAIARAAGIPAREINGYAYTENKEIQPLSLVADVLHSWPEYWSQELKAWVPIDPTWASTTGGVDYFSKLDLRHFNFVIHGKDANKPYPPGSYKLGPNPQKDVFVSFGQLPEKRKGINKISIVPKTTLPFQSSKAEVLIKNPGPAAHYSLAPSYYFDSQLVKVENIDVLPAYASYKTEISIPFSFLGRKTPDILEVRLGDQTARISTFKKQVIVYNLLVLFTIFVVITIMVFLALRLRKKKHEPVLTQVAENPQAQK